MEGYRRNKHYLSRIIYDYSPKIIFLQEIWLALSDSKLVENDFPDFNFKISTPDMFMHVEDKIGKHGHVWHGVAIAWHNDLCSQVTQLDSNYERFSAIRLNLGETNLLAISLYAPTSGKDEEFLECISYLSNFLTRNRTANDVVIIGTDSNCSSKSTQRRKTALNDFCNNFDVQVVSTQVPTFHHNK